MSTKTANVNIRITPELKAAVENLYAQFGISLSDAVNIFFHKSLMEGGLPFEMKQPRFNPSVEAAMQEAKDIESGKIHTKIYDNFEDLLKDV